MEPRARAGKNVGQMNFKHQELAQLLYGHGDVRAPLPETVRVLDEIATDFIQSTSFQAAQTAHHAGRQKVKFEDFEFAMRRNTAYMGRLRQFFEQKKEIESARKTFKDDEFQMAKDAAGEGGAGAGGGAKRGRKRKQKEAQAEEEVLGEGDDDAEAERDIVGHAPKKR